MAMVCSFVAPGSRRHKPMLVTAMAILLLRPAGSEQCGIKGFVDKVGFFHESALDRPGREPREASCGICSVTDCTGTLAEVQPSCPRECAFVAPSSVHRCLFSCVTQEPGHCSDYNSATAFANPDTHLCEACDVFACKVCTSKNKCSQCHHGFELSEDNKECHLKLDRESRIGTILHTVAILLACLIVFAVFYGCLRGPRPTAAANLEAIRLGHRHRRMVKLKEWNLSGQEVKKFRFWVNVHTKWICGVGLALFYNARVFLALVSCFCLFGTWYVQSKAKLAEDEADLNFQEERGEARSLESCAHGAEEVLENMGLFADDNVLMICTLYIILFVLSLIYGWFQKRHAAYFEAQHRTMSDYALRIQGVGADETDELELTRKLQEKFQAMEPDMQPLVGVSIAYDYSRIWGVVDEVMFRFLSKMDLDAGTHPKDVFVTEDDEAAVEGHATAADSQLKLLNEAKRDEMTVRDWFDGVHGEKIKGSGEVFCVFRTRNDQRAIKDKLNGKLRWDSSTEVTVHEVMSEPPAVFWWHFGVQRCHLVCRVVQAALKVVFLMALYFFGVFCPIMKHLILPYTVVGAGAGSTLMAVFGVLMGQINQLICIQIWANSWGLGFHRKDRMDRFIFVANFTLNLMNNAFYWGSLIFRVAVPTGLTFEEWVSGRSLRSAAFEIRLANDMFWSLVPGALFTGYLMTPVMAGIMPYFWNSFLQVMIYVWGALPQPLLAILKLFLPWAPSTYITYPVRRAEKAMEQPDVGLPWEYSDHILMPLICFSTLFLMSPVVWKVFAGMLAWSIFLYVWGRWIHLRFNRANYYTTSRLDVVVTYVWGIPLSVVAAAWAFWTLRSPKYKWMCDKPEYIPVAFAASLILWVFCYSLLQPWKADHVPDMDGEIDYETTRSDMLYSWFNVNPVYVLKCYYYPEKVVGCVQPEGREKNQIRFYEIGKEYLLMSPENRKNVMEAISKNDFTELETCLDKVWWLLELISCPGRGRGRVCCCAAPDQRTAMAQR